MNSAPMAVRFDVEAYRVNPWPTQNPDGLPYPDGRYAVNKQVWRGYAEMFMTAAREHGAQVYLDVCTNHNGDIEESEQYNCTAYMTAGQFHRMLLDVAHTAFGKLIRRGTLIAASIADGYEHCLDAQSLQLDPILHYLGSVYIDGEYEGEGPSGNVEEWAA